MGYSRADVYQSMFMFKREPLSYFYFPFWVDVINSPRLTTTVGQEKREVVLQTSRQVGKTSACGVISNGMCIEHKNFVNIITQPTDVQISRFSVDVIKGITEDSIVTSEIFFDPKMNQRQVKNKSFANRSRMILANIYASALSARGIPGDMCWIDEAQDTPEENAEIVIAATKRSPYKFVVYSGTPLEPENNLSRKFENSTQNEWAVRCTHCGHWNIDLGLQNVGKKGLICSHCYGRINSRNGMWVTAFKNRDREGFHVNELAVPSDAPGATSWAKLLNDLSGKEKIVYNEILGKPYSSEKHPLTHKDIMDCCDNSRKYICDARDTSDYGTELLYCYAGLDWAMETSSRPGDKDIKSYTMLTIVSYSCGKMKVVFRKKYYDKTNQYDDPDRVVEDILYWLNLFNVRIVGMDWGIGNKENKRIMNEFGLDRCMAFNYVGNLVENATYSVSANKWMISKTREMDNTVDAIHDHFFEFANWEETSIDIDDFTGIYKVFNHDMRTARYGKSKPDDFFQNLVYINLVARYSLGTLEYKIVE